MQCFLRPGPGFITADWDRFVAASQLQRLPRRNAGDRLVQHRRERRPDRRGFHGLVSRSSTATPISATTRLRYNVGVRWVRTDQTVGGRVSIADPRNTPPAPAAALADGARFPNIVNFAEIDNTYENWLPAANVALNVTDNFVVRGALSQTMTRPNPNDMLPGLNFSSPSADVGTVGNSELEPYLSDNIDLGFEYYTGGDGYFGVAAFRKGIEGFTVLGSKTVPFTDLAQYGVTFDTLDAGAAGGHQLTRRS